MFLHGDLQESLHGVTSKVCFLEGNREGSSSLEICVWLETEASCLVSKFSQAIEKFGK